MASMLSTLGGEFCKPCKQLIGRGSGWQQQLSWLEEVADDIAFRSGYGSQSVLLRALEDWRQAFYNHQHVGAILMDLSKAFDCFPHNLLLGKLQAYGLGKSSIGFISSYLSGRKQQVRLRPETSKWTDVKKGPPGVYCRTSNF
ncbi:uncharacterized protein LOC110454067 [Mizuhopecten yessoensis]|uniref:uncharacterized protein LOC110454067 n=1 Tax=Mizuhopecten yessoensis TaxID=6573 RepID=UPI000B45B44A|nr:uncharacterized protein LOC110454067 [Mizuhopecten yessoensis]